MPAAPLARTK